MHTLAHLHVHIYIHTSLHRNIFLSTHVCLYAHVFNIVHKLPCICIFLSLWICIYEFLHLQLQIYARNMCIYIDMCFCFIHTVDEHMNKYQRLCHWLSHLQLQGFTPPQPDWKHKSKLHMWRNTVWNSCKQVRVFPCSEYFGFSKSIRNGTSCIEWFQDHNITVNGTMEPVIWFRGTSLWFLQWVLPIHCKFFACGYLQFTDLTYAFIWIHILLDGWSPPRTLWKTLSKVSIRMRIQHPKFLTGSISGWTVLGQAGWQATYFYRW